MVLNKKTRWAAKKKALPEQPAADRKPRGGRWLLWLSLPAAAIVLYGFNIIIEMSYHGPHHPHHPHHPHQPPPAPRMELPSRTRANAFLVDSAGCRMPALDPWDPIVMKYVKTVKPLECEAGRGRPLVASNLTSLFVLEEALPDYKVSDIADLACCYKPFYRKPFVDNRERYADYCTAFEKEVNVEHEEFLRVECSVKSSVIYVDYHAFVPRKAAVEERCKIASLQSSFQSDAPSVLLLGIDTVSRLNFHRQMPRTAALLRQLGAVEMLGYNKVGDNTFDNLVPILSGQSVTELRNSCWPTNGAHFDKCPFLWKDYSKAGYRTGYGEDAAWLGAFNTQKGGFSEQPTKYYARTFIKQMEDKIGHKRPFGVKLCAGSRMIVDVLLQYAWKFARTFRDDRSFALFWACSVFHNDINYASLADLLYTRLFSSLAESGVLQQSVVILLSDHGKRWGDFRETYHGRLEERLPFLFLLFPDWFRERYAAAVDNVSRNARRLTTPFDLHETLRDLLRPAARLSQEEVRRRSQAVAEAAEASGGAVRGLSLFLQLPPDRTCEDAGISPHWCTCQTSAPVDLGSAIVNRTAEILVDRINEIISSFRECAHLKLAEIRDVQMQVPQEFIKKDLEHPDVRDYVLVVRTEPGNALFEGTLRYIPETDNLTVAGFVSRLNSYGSQSACVNNYRVKLYCFCSF